MSRYKEVKSKIQKQYDKLPKNHKRIADYFIENFDRIPFLNLKELSEATQSSVASIVRFSQRIGFTGYSDIRDEIGASLQNQLINKEIFTLFDKKELKKDTLSDVAELDIKNINDTVINMDRASFRKAIDLIRKADRVYTAGLGISFLLAEILAYQLTQTGIDSEPLRHTWLSFPEHAWYMKKNDLLIAFSFPPYSRETILTVKQAHQRGIKVISVTNKDSAPVAHHSNVSLIVKSDNLLYTNSFAAISVLINAIATECALKDKERAKLTLGIFNEINEDQDQIL